MPIRFRSIQILMLIYALLATLTIIFFNGTGDSGDSILHYLHAKYAIVHPENLVKHWAKPIFTLIALPFAQMGFIGMKIMNAVFTGLTIYFTYKSALALNMRNPLLAAIILLASPLYFSLTFSGLTEPMFALFVSLGLYSSINGRLIPAALLISFLPFVRTEGFIILAIFAVYFLLKAKSKLIPLLFTGLVIYSIAGSFYYDDLFWVFSKVPYVANEDVYGSGELFHFVDQLVFVTGVPNYALLGIGLILLLMRLFKGKLQLEFSVLILGGFLSYFIAHSLFWYLGGFNSLGLKRVLIGLMPFIGIICLIAYNFLTEELFKSKSLLKRSIQFSLVILILVFPFTKNHAALQIERDLKLSEDQLMAIEISLFLDSTDKSENRIVCAPTYFCEILNKDPFNGNQRLNLTHDALKVLRIGDILIWDDWYAGFENTLPLSLLRDRKDLIKLHSLERNHNGRLIEYHVFEKIRD